MSATRLAVVMPLANEEATTKELLTRIGRQIGPFDRVFCILDDASRDGTRDCVEAFAARDSRVTCVWSPENRNVVDAYFRGYGEALDSGALWVLEMDGGLSHSPEEIPRFVEAMDAGTDYAGGSRFMRGASWSGPPGRFVVSRGGTLLANLLLGTRMSDMTSGYECFTRDAMKLVVGHGVHSQAHFFQTEIRFLMHRVGFVEIPISYRAPSNRLGSSSILDAFRGLWRLHNKEGRIRRRPRA
jgi:dolichol-phosphate mannosyltransferase